MRPLLMVHGLGGSARDTFGAPGRISRRDRPGSMYLFLRQQGYQPGRDLFWYTYNSWQPVSVSAGRLEREIAAVRDGTGSSSLDLLTFSLGGIVSKYYAVSPSYRQEIRNLVMIAPPFLGSPWANCLRSRWVCRLSERLFSDESRRLAPQVLSFGNPFLMELAQRPFPAGIDTTIIAARGIPGVRHDPLTGYARWLTTWLGEGDSMVPVQSTRIQVNHYYEIAEEFSVHLMHRFLPCHPQIQQLAARHLRYAPAVGHG